MTETDGDIASQPPFVIGGGVVDDLLDLTGGNAVAKIATNVV
jgi:hypothetical protein